jgi:3-oxoacyl-[acyl-carrier-protein] synthase II
MESGSVGMPPLDQLRASLLSTFESRDYLPKGNLRPLDRPSQFVTSAAALALDNAGLDMPPDGVRRMGIVAGTMFSGAATISEFDIRGRQEGPSRVSALDFANTVINAAAGQTALWHRMKGTNSTISAGGSSGLQAIAYGAEMIRNGREDAILAGGFESVSSDILAAISRSSLFQQEHGTSPFKSTNDAPGLHVSEGAAFLVLEDQQTAVDRGAEVKARVAGFASRFCSGLNLNHALVDSADMERFTNAVSSVMNEAIADAGLVPGDIDLVSLSARNAGYLDTVEVNAIRTVFEGSAAVDSILSTSLSGIGLLMGDSLGAMGAFQVIDAVESLMSGTVGARIRLQCDQTASESTACSERIHSVLISSTSRDGHCSSLVLVSG